MRLSGAFLRDTTENLRAASLYASIVGYAAYAPLGTENLLLPPEGRPELLSWLLFIASGLGPFSGQSVHFQFAAPEGND
jgi:hypothetical protein